MPPGIQKEKIVQRCSQSTCRFPSTHLNHGGVVQLSFRFGPCSLMLEFWIPLFHSEFRCVQAEFITRNRVLGKLPVEVSLHLPTDSVSHLRWLRYSLVKVWETSLSLLFSFLVLFTVWCQLPSFPLPCYWISGFPCW